MKIVTLTEKQLVDLILEITTKEVKKKEVSIPKDVKESISLKDFLDKRITKPLSLVRFTNNNRSIVLQTLVEKGKPKNEFTVSVLNISSSKEYKKSFENFVKKFSSNVFIVKKVTTDRTSIKFRIFDNDSDREKDITLSISKITGA